MAAVKLKLVPNPIFYAKVEIPAAGEDPMEVVFTFKHKTKDQLDEWLKGEKADVDAIMEMAEGWDMEEPFDRANVATLEQNYQAAPLAILMKYIKELREGKTKN